MNAIVGIFSRRGRLTPEASLIASLAQLADNGTPKSQVWTDSVIGLGLIRSGDYPDQHTGTSPFYDSVSDVAVTADIRLDNRGELLSTLGLQNTKETPSDIRLLLGAWLKWKEECPNHLVGDFAFAIWDSRRKSLFCARDHIGVRPFFYSLTSDQFVFASAPESIRGMPGVSDRPDDEYIIASLEDSSLYSKDRTYLNSVRKLAPGHSITVNTSSERIARYWFPENSKEIRFSNDLEYAEAAFELYSRAVKDRLKNDHAVGVHLSGGLDSSSIAVMVARERRRQGKSPPAVFSWQPPPNHSSKDLGEHTRIETICKSEGLDVQYCPMNARDIVAVIRNDSSCQPAESSLLVETTTQKRASEQGVRLILSGWGGDDGLSFGSRGYYSNLLLRGRWRKLYQAFKPFGSPSKLFVMEALLLLFRDRSEGIAKISARSLRSQNNLLSFLAPNLKENSTLRSPFSRQTSIRSTMLWIWNSGWLAQRMESWAVSGEKRGIRYAYPLLDRRIMEFVAGLPPEQFVRGKWNRWIMRNAMDGVLPDEVRWCTDKDDTVRCEQALNAIYEALEIIGKHIADSTEAPSRAKYLDWDLLQECLRPEFLAKRPKQLKQRKIFHALQFVDF